MFEPPPAMPNKRRRSPLCRHCDQLAAQGDLLGLLDYLETRDNPALLRESLGMISRCIRVRAQTDVSGLCEDAFARILGMAVLLLTKVQLYIETRLREDVRVDGHTLSQIPRDLTEDGWLERMERLSRFVAEMATTRARVRHLNGLGDETTGSKRRKRRSRAAPTLAADRGQTAGGQGPSGNGRVRRQAAAPEQHDSLGSPVPRTQCGPLVAANDLFGAPGTRTEGPGPDPALAGPGGLTRGPAAPGAAGPARPHSPVS
ncbi:MAG: hypothetical protein ABIG44_11745 [Planctomycetota bacterium]